MQSRVHGRAVRTLFLLSLSLFLIACEQDDLSRKLASGSAPSARTQPQPGDAAESSPPPTLNIAFTYEGLYALGLSAATLSTFPPEFRL